MRSKILKLSVLLAGLLSLPGLTPAGEKTGFLILAPDRGFMGNEETREAFEEYRPKFLASLAYVTREETERFIGEGIRELERLGASEIVAIPLFVSRHQDLYRKAERIFSQNGGKNSKVPVRLAGSMSGSYLLSEILADRVATLSRDPAKEMLVLTAQGTQETADSLQVDLLRVAHQIHDRYSFADFAAVAVTGRGETSTEKLEKKLAEARSKKLTPVLVPLDFSSKLDGMMSFTAGLKSTAKKNGAAYDGNDLTPHPNIALYLGKESNSHLPVTAKNLGVIFMPHGSSHVWNRTMLDAIAPLQSKYMIEPVFSMGDPPLIEKGVRKLEKRGARAVTVIRVFSLESSFRDGTEYILGLRDMADHSAHGHGGEMQAPAKIRSGSAFHTLGGLEDSPLFAEALLDRAYAVSKKSEQETVILLAHGTENEEQNNHWLKNLSSLAAHMKKTAEAKGKPFRDVKFAAWREDWPKLREKASADIRKMVEEASKDGKAIVIPARTTKAGSEEEWLKGLDYVFNGNGFAPHPKFTQWVEAQIQKSLEHFNRKEGVSVATSQAKETHAHH